MDIVLGRCSEASIVCGVAITPAPNETVRQCLEASMKSRSEIASLVNFPTIDLKIELPCGEKVTYTSLDDIPETDVPCTCGNPNHWFIKIKRSI